MRHRSVLAACLLAAAPAVAGPLDPPAGPIAPTMKTLDQVEPSTPLTALDTPGDADSVFRITAPGAYHLTANLTGEAGKHGIEIAARNVTLDLRGFALLGVPGSLDGVIDQATLNAVVRNGSVFDFGGNGVFLPGSASRIEGVRVRQCGGFGLGVGPGGAIERSAAEFCAGDGFQVSSGTIARCEARFNLELGFLLVSGSATDCNAESNTLGDFRAFDGAVLERCVSTGSLARGFEVGAHCVLRACSVRLARRLGIVAGENALIESCVAERCNTDDDPAAFAAAIKAGDGSVVRGCVARDNPNDAGILVEGQSVVDRCQAIGNGTNGISALDNGPRNAATITGCVATGNGVHGIVARGAAISECSARGNTRNGIYLVAGGTIDACEAHDNEVGIALLGAGGAVRGCATTGNTLYGILTESGSSTAGWLIADCAAVNNGDGIGVINGSAAVRCVARGNGNFGITATIGSSVEGCVASNNTRAGIFAFSGCHIIGNTCADNAAGQAAPLANIACAFGTSRNRVEGNHVTGAAGDTGIRVDNKDSLIIKNTVSGCGVPYDLGQNSFGPIIDVSAATDLSAVPGADHPWANLIH
jgi:hypothetical protein